MIQTYAARLVRIFNNLTNRVTSPQISLTKDVNKVIEAYESYIGIKEVRDIQQSVLKFESQFIESSKVRRATHERLIGVQKEKDDIRKKLLSTDRASEQFLELISNEHKVIKDEIRLQEDLRSQEQVERELFSRLSERVRDHHAAERWRLEKVKYLSWICSVIGALIGIVATSISYALRRHDYKKLIQLLENNTQQIATVAPQQTSQSSPPILPPPSDDGSDSPDEPKVVREFDQDIENVEKLLEATKESHDSLELKMKINTIICVVATYTLLAITLPLIMKLG